MKTLIIYASKHGATKEIVHLLANNSCDIKDIIDKDIDLSSYDNVVLGSGTYAGILDKHMKEFIRVQEETLLQKELYLFISGLSGDSSSMDKVCAENIPANILSHITYKDHLGGRLNMPDMNLFEKTLIKMINKKGHFYTPEQAKNNIDLLNYERIKLFKDKLSKV
ncbi:flavodoxin domain-containing protein [Amedibacillus sp. YH-ame6]